MSQPVFTLKDYIASLVKKEDCSSPPPPPKPRDFDDALTKEGKGKSKEFSLSPEARPFLPLKPSYISVSSLSSPAVSYSIPVFSSSLPLCFLREFFPQATRMHYIIDQQMVTLATINSYAMVDGMELELSDQKFLLPHLQPHIQYYVTDDMEEVVTKETLMDEALKGVRGIRDKMKTVLADVDALEEKVLRLQTQAQGKMNESSMMISNGHICVANTEDVFTNQVNVDENSHHNYGREYAELREECLGDEKESDMKSVLTDVIVDYMNPVEMGGTDDNTAVVEKKCFDDNTAAVEKKCIDDYGFSDSDDDNSEQVLGKVDSIHVAESRVETSLSPRKLDSCSLSSRPRCVRRVMGQTSQ